MAEATGLRNNALPYPVYGVPFGITFPLLDADGDPISPSSPDSERSLNGDTFADCTNEATEIATSSGVCYLLLTAAEMTADVVTVRIQSTGAKTTVITLYPAKLPVLSSGTCQGSNDTGDITLASSEPALNDIYNGCLCVATIDTVVEARLINDYVGSSKVAEISPAWNTAQPDSNDTYVIYAPLGRAVTDVNVAGLLGTAWLTPGTAGTPDVNTKLAGGTAWGSGAITAASIATDAIDADALADGAITAATFAAGAIDASAIAADAIGASELAADAATEIATAVWASADRQLTALDEDATTIDLNATTIGTVTTLTNLPAITANWLTAAGVAADVATELAAPILAVLGALADAASDGDPTTTDTAISYLKQIINTLEGSAGIPTFPSAAAPANAVSLAEIIRSIYTQLGVAGAGLTAIPGPDSQTLSKHIEWIGAATHGDCNITGSGPYTVEYLDILGNIVISSVSDNGERTVTRS